MNLFQEKPSNDMSGMDIVARLISVARLEKQPHYSVNIRTLKIFLVSSIILLSLVTPHTAFAGTTFSVQVLNLSNSGATNSFTPKLSTSGSSVYVIWQEGTSIFFINSTDDGATFPDAAISLGAQGTAFDPAPQIKSTGTNVYVAWAENSDISFIHSNDNGDSFDAKKDLSGTAGVPSFDPQLAVSGSNVYVAWREDSDIFFRNSTDNGDTFPDVPLDLNAASSTVRTPQIAASGSNIYVIWRDGSDISFIRSTDRGDTFPVAPTDIGDTGGTSSPKPEIVASGSNVHVVWQQGTNISYRRSTDSGATFEAPITLGSIGASTLPNQKIVVDGTKVYVVWQNGNDIAFRRSTDSGATFEAEVNLSSTAEASALSHIAASSNNVFVVWREDTAGDANDKDIRFKSSTDGGATFGGVTDLSSNTILANFPIVASSGNDVFIAWSEETSGSSNGEIRFSKGTATATQVAFDAAQYKLSGTATITVTDSALNTNAGATETISGTVTSTSDGVGITSMTLTETDDNTGVFSGTITFTDGATSGTTLHAVPGDAITATFAGVSDGATIFSRSVAWDSNPYDRGDIAFFTVIDQNSNLDSGVAETISVLVTSQEAAHSTTLTLTESGVDTGIFGGSANVKLIFTEGDDRFPTTGTVTVTVENTAANTGISSIDTTNVSVTSDTDPVGITLTLTETGVNTSRFTGKLTLTTGASNGATKSIKVSAGDFLSVTSGAFTSHALITPNADPAKGLLQVKITDTTPETITATFGGVSASSSVDFIGGEPGGGGGGLVRPGLVLDAVAAIAILGGGGGGNSPPTIGASSITILGNPQEGLGGIIDEGQNKKSSNQKSAGVGEPVVLRFDIFESQGINYIGHVTLYLKEGALDENLENNNFIRFEKYKGNSINDKSGIFSNAKFEILEKDATNLVLKFEIVFAKPIEASDLMLDVWDLDRRSSRQLFEDAIVVEPQQSSGIVSTQIDSEISTDTELVDNVLEEAPIANDTNEIPPWIKVSARWWSDGEISNNDFVLGIEYLAKNNIIDIPSTETEEETSKEIPGWIKNTAEWWSDGNISDKEFVQAIQYLIKIGVMRV
jgi:hypothetical protein